MDDQCIPFNCPNSQTKRVVGTWLSFGLYITGSVGLPLVPVSNLGMLVSHGKPRRLNKVQQLYSDIIGSGTERHNVTQP